MSSSTSSSSSVSSFYTTNGVTRLNGSEFASGLDTESLITALTANTTAKINKQKQLEQKAEWKQDMYQEVEDLLQTFSDSYFSYSTSSSTNIMSTSFFDSDALVSSNSSVVTATGDSSDAGNVVIDSISQIATAASYTGTAVSKTSIDSTKAIGSTISSSSYLNLSVNGTSYTLTLGKSFDSSDSSLAADLATQLQSQVSSNSSLKGKVTFSADNGKISVSGATVTGASQNFIDGLGITSTTPGSTTTYALDGTKAVDGTSLASLGNQLAGTTLTVQLDGLSKTISFDKSKSDQYSTSSTLASFLQSQMDTAFGSGKVTVSETDDKLSISTADTTSVLQFTSSSDSGVLGTDGVLHITSGETNRTELDKTLDELSSELNTSLSAGSDGSYSFSINGKKFTFSGSTELNTVINTINDDTTADVTVSYSQTLNKFHIVSKDTGSQGTITIADETDGGNLASSLFGSVATGGTATSGTDLSMKAKLGGTSTEQTINRSTNSFTLDGVTLNITGTTDSSVSFSASDDVDDLYTKISTFVDKYNEIISKINTDVTTTPATTSTSNSGGTDYEPLTDSQKTSMTDTEITAWNTKAKQGLLFSDTALTNLQTNIRTAMESSVSSVGLSLADIGISTADSDYTSGGKLVINETTLKNALKSESSKVEQLFTNSDGISSRVKDVLTENIGVYGNSGTLYNIAGSSTMIGTDNSEMGKEITEYASRIKELKTQLSDEQDRLQTKFTNMETIISKLSSQYDYISNMSSSSSS